MLRSGPLVPVSGTSEKRLLLAHPLESLLFLPRTLSKVRIIFVAAMVNIMKTLKNLNARCIAGTTLLLLSRRF